MKNIELEAFALNVVDQLMAGHIIEDSRVELKKQSGRRRQGLRGN